MEFIKIKPLLKAYFSENIFPKSNCSFCQKPISNSSLFEANRFYSIASICSLCKEQIEMPLIPYCEICHKPISNVITKNEELICGDCSKNKLTGVIYNRSAVVYNSFIKEMVAQYKYRGKESLASIFSDFLAIAYDQYFSSERIDYLTYVPIHLNRVKVRGFNQSQLLAHNLERYSGIPVIETLIKIKDTEKQSKYGKLERLKQIEGSFAVKGDNRSFLGKNILIIDDIYTTGSTIKECTTVLKHAGANQVYSLTLARA